MSEARTMRIGAMWAVHRAEGIRALRYRDFVIDGARLGPRLSSGHVTPFGWGPPEMERAAIDRLLARGEPDLARGRVSLYVCGACGDLGCGAISVLLDARANRIAWRAFGVQNDRDDEIWPLQDATIDALEFDAREYTDLLASMRADTFRRRH